MNNPCNRFRELLTLDAGLQNEKNKQAFKNKSYFGGIAQVLLEKSGEEFCLDTLMRCTADSAKKHIRKSYKEELSRKQTVAAEDEESRLERAAWLRWKLGKKRKPETPFLPQCPYLVTYQLPLFNRQSRGGWGKIDLLGLSADDLTPVVVELKKGKSGESPLRMLLEATAYTIAVRVAWNCGLRDEWKKTIESLALDHGDKDKLGRLPKELKHCTAICLAPPEYWASCKPYSSKEYSKGAWDKFGEVQNRLTQVWGINFILAECSFECRERLLDNKF